MKATSITHKGREIAKVRSRVVLILAGIAIAMIGFFLLAKDQPRVSRAFGGIVTAALPSLSLPQPIEQVLAN